MKTLKQISLLCLFWMIGMSVSAYDFAAKNEDGVTIYYNITSSTSPKTVEVTNDGNTSTSVYTAETINIPNTVSYGGNTYGVTGIGEKAFYYAETVKSITLPKFLTSIGDYAFYYCRGLTSITIPNSVTSIKNNAFRNCRGLTSVIIPNSVTSIGDYAFYGCTGLTSVTIGNSVTSIGEYAFNSCENANIILTSKNAPTLGSSAFYNVKAVYYPKCYDWSNSYPYHAYTTLITNVNGSYSFENIDRWSKLEIKENCKEYKVIADVSAFLLSASYTRTFNNHEWQAWYIPADVPFSSLSANFEVAKFSDTQASADEIEIESVTSGTLTANTPYLVRLKDDKATGEYSIVADESAGLKETVENEVNIGSNYKLKTTYRELSGEELKGKYALSEGKFKKAGDSATLKPFRVYLEPVTTGAADVLDLVMDGATDITLTPSSGKGAETIYNLNGQAVGEDYKGIVIKNGKKVFKN